MLRNHKHQWRPIWAIPNLQLWWKTPLPQTIPNYPEHQYVAQWFTYDFNNFIRTPRTYGDHDGATTIPPYLCNILVNMTKCSVMSQTKILYCITEMARNSLEWPSRKILLLCGWVSEHYTKQLRFKQLWVKRHNNHC